MSENVQRTVPSRLVHLDLVRGWAIFLMVLIHTVRGFLDRSYKVPASVDMSNLVERTAVAVRGFLYTTEPYISALFLTVSGFALSIAYRPGARGYGKRVKRGIQLALLSWLIHWIHAGVNPPYPFLSAEILYTIGLGIIIFAPLAGPSSFRWPLLAALSLLCIAVTWFAEGHPEHWAARLAQGPGAHLPNLLFFPVGILLASAWQKRNPRLVWGLLAAGLAVLVIYHGAVAPGIQAEAAEAGYSISTTEAIFNRPFGRIVSDRKFVVDARFGSTYDLKWVGHKLGFVEQAPRKFLKRRSYWNKKLALMPYLLGWMAVTFALAWLLFGDGRDRQPRPRDEGPQSHAGDEAPLGYPRGSLLLVRPLALMGRYPLFLYLLHLAVIAALVALIGGNRAGPLGTFGAMAGMVALCVGVAWLRERRRGRPRPVL